MKFKGKKEVVKAVQKLLGVSADGEDGPVTWNAILSELSTKKDVMNGEDIAAKMVTLARKEIGVAEACTKGEGNNLSIKSCAKVQAQAKKQRDS